MYEKDQEIVWVVSQNNVWIQVWIEQAMDKNEVFVGRYVDLQR